MIFSRDVVYVRFKKDWMHVRIQSRDRIVGEYSDVAQVLVNTFTQKALAFGEAASNDVGDNHTELRKPFDHPRLVFGNFEDALSILKDFIVRAKGDRQWLQKPDIFIHPLEKMEGGLASIEIRGLLELARQAGAGFAMVSEVDNELTYTDMMVMKWK